MSDIIYVTEDEVWQRIRDIYAKHPDFIGFPENDWCECNGCQESEIAERYGWASDALRDWETLQENLFLAGVERWRPETEGDDS